MDEPTLYQQIDALTHNIPDLSATREALKDAAYRMEKAGWPNEIILELLQRIYAGMLGDFAKMYHERDNSEYPDALDDNTNP